MEIIKIGKTYVHLRTQMAYHTIGFIKVKLVNGEWTDCVKYCRIQEPNNEFGRDIESFKRNFSEV